MLVPSVCPSPVFPPTTMGTLVESALAYAIAGIPVFPLRPGDKIPCVAHGFHAATTDLACIRAWWQKQPEANIGVPTGTASGLIVLDIDPRHGGSASLRHLQRVLDHHADDLQQSSPDMDKTCLSLSGGGGLHLFFACPSSPSVLLHSTTRFAGEDGLDLRAQGGYIVVAPSRLFDGGYYRWLPSPPLQPFPAALIELLATRARPQFISSRVVCRQGNRRHDPAYWLEFVLARCVIGNRHDQALFLACRLLQEAGLSPPEAEPWMLLYASRVPQGTDPTTHYPASDALACLAWAQTHV